MDKMVIAGGKRLAGEVRISGAKNAALPILASSLLVDGWNTFHNIPDLLDIKTIKKLLKSLGVEMEGEETLRINAGGITNCEAAYDLVRTMRASILVLGPLVARMGEARVSLPGGCAIGARPVNLHIKALQETRGGGDAEGRVCRGEGLAPEGGGDLFRYLDGDGDGKHHDGRDAGGRDHRPEERGARAGGRQPCRDAHRHGGEDPRGGERRDRHRRGGASPSRGGGGDPGPDRDRHLSDRRRDHRRRYPGPRLRSPPSRRPDRQASGCRDEDRRGRGQSPGERAAERQCGASM